MQGERKRSFGKRYVQCLINPSSIMSDLVHFVVKEMTAYGLIRHKSLDKAEWYARKKAFFQFQNSFFSLKAMINPLLTFFFSCVLAEILCFLEILSTVILNVSCYLCNIELMPILIIILHHLINYTFLCLSCITFCIQLDQFHNDQLDCYHPSYEDPVYKLSSLLSLLGIRF